MENKVTSTKTTDIAVYPPEVQALIENARVNEDTLLDLSRKHLTAIPSEVFELEHLERLDLYNNLIQVVPPTIKRLKKLKKLYLSDNLLRELPAEISELPELEYISLIENPYLKSLPPEINSLNKLKNIYVDDNDMLEILKYKGWMVHVIALPEEIKLPIKQYLVFFSEFVRIAKAEIVGFEVRSRPGGLELHLKSNHKRHYQKIASYMKEYLDLVRQGVVDLRITGHNHPDRTALFIAELKEQINFLQRQIEHKKTETDILNREIKRMRQVLDTKMKGGAHILPFLEVSETTKGKRQRR